MCISLFCFFIRPQQSRRLDDFFLLFSLFLFLLRFVSHPDTHLFALDLVTGNQMVGLTDLDFVVEHIGWENYYPLDKSKLERKYDCFLIHLPGISGGLWERAEIRTRHVILEAIYDSSIVYTNGESYILTYNFTQQ